MNQNTRIIFAVISSIIVVGYIGFFIWLSLNGEEIKDNNIKEEQLEKAAAAAEEKLIAEREKAVAKKLLLPEEEVLYNDFSGDDLHYFETSKGNYKVIFKGKTAQINKFLKSGE